MDSNNNGYTYNPPPVIPGSGLANTAILLGIISIVTALMMTVAFPFILGSLAIVLGILSKGRSKKLLKQAKSGIICGVIGLTVNLAIVISTAVMLLSNPDALRETAQMYDSMYEQVYGQSSEDILGDSMENMVDHFLERIN